jgi:hypothetical protein
LPLFNFIAYNGAWCGFNHLLPCAAFSSFLNSEISAPFVSLIADGGAYTDSINIIFPGLFFVSTATLSVITGLGGCNTLFYWLISFTGGSQFTASTGSALTINAPIFTVRHVRLAIPG